MTGNKSHIADYQELKMALLTLEVLFTDTNCLVLSLDFKLPDENQVLLKIPRQHNMCSFNLKNIDPFGDLACLFAKSLIDESNKWHRRLVHVNFKNLNKLVKGNLVRGLHSKIFKNDHTCVACQKGKQHKASCKAKATSSVNQPLQILHMDYILENQANKSTGPKEANNSAGTQANDDQGANSEEIDLHEKHFVLPIRSAYSTTVKSSGDKIEQNTGFKTCEKPVSQVEQVFLEELEKLKRQEKKANDAAGSLRKEATHDIQNASTSSSNLINTASTLLSTVGPSRAFNDGELSYPNPSKYALPDDTLIPYLEDIYASLSEGIFINSSYDDEGVVTDFNNLETTVKHKENGIFISQDNYVAKILKKFDFLSVKIASTPIETQKPLVKDEETANVDVTPKTSLLQAVKRIFRYLKGQPKLGLRFKFLVVNIRMSICSYMVSGEDKIDMFKSCCTVDQPPLTESSSKHDSSQDPRVDLKGTCGSGGDHVNLPYDSPFSSGHISDRAEGSLNLEALFAFFTNLSNRVIALETGKDAQAKEILTLKARIKKLEKKCKPSISHHKAWLRSVSLLSKKKKMSKRKQELSTVGPTTTPTTTKIFDDEEMTLADILIKLKDEKAKGVAFKDSESTDRPARLILTLKPLLTIDPKDKGKGVLEEPESAKKMTKKLERERQREEQASMNYIANLYDEVQARIDVDHELAVRWTHEEQEKYIVDERAKLLAEYFERRKKQLVEERAAKIRNKPLTKTQLRRLMMTYLKNMGKFSHSQLNKKSFEDIHDLYMKEHELITDFVPIGSEEDERMIKDMNKKTKEERNDKGVDSTKKRKARSRMKRMSKRKKTDVDLKEEEKLKPFLKIDPDEEGIIDYEVLDKRFPIMRIKILSL
nr:putative ribonuclease H-like domain-containing protein [Tanacetum cinerariifolium]